MRKVLLCYDHDENTGTVNLNNYLTCMAWLERMGYDVDGRAVSPNSEWLEQFEYSSFEFEFIVFLTGTFGFGPSNKGTVILDGRARIPTFCVGINKADTNSTMLSIGIERLTAQSV